MMSLGQKAIAIGTVLFLNVLAFLFVGALAVFALLPSLGMIAVILRR